MTLDERNRRCTFEGKRVALSAASLIAMEGRLVDVPHFGVVAMPVIDDRTDYRQHKPEDLQSRLQDFSRNLELSIWPPLGNSVLVQESIDPLAIDQYMFGADLAP